MSLSTRSLCPENLIPRIVNWCLWIRSVIRKLLCWPHFHWTAWCGRGCFSEPTHSMTSARQYYAKAMESWTSSLCLSARLNLTGKQRPTVWRIYSASWRIRWELKSSVCPYSRQVSFQTISCIFRGFLRTDLSYLGEAARSSSVYCGFCQRGSYMILSWLVG